jgi:hypothetical protein
MREPRNGVTVEEYGDQNVFLAVQGKSTYRNQAEIQLTPAEARRLAIKLLQMADKQERFFQQLRAYKTTETKTKRAAVKGSKRTATRD